MESVRIASGRESDLRKARALEYATLAWMTIEFAASLILGLVSGSLLLIAFGFDSLIELVSAVVLMWRLGVELGGGAEVERAESVERRAAKWAGYLLFALAAYVVAGSSYGLLLGHQADTGQSVWGLVIAVVAVVTMPLLAHYKRKLAAPSRLNSRSLRADATEAASCAYLAGVVVVGLLLSRLLGWWWLDSAAALALVPFVVREGLEAVEEGEAHEE